MDHFHAILHKKNYVFIEPLDLSHIVAKASDTSGAWRLRHPYFRAFGLSGGAQTCSNTSLGGSLFQL